MICNRCGDHYPNILPAPMSYVTYSDADGGVSYNYCASRCAPYIKALLDSQWTMGETPVVVDVNANGMVAE